MVDAMDRWRAEEALPEIRFHAQDVWHATVLQRRKPKMTGDRSLADTIAPANRREAPPQDRLQSPLLAVPPPAPLLPALALSNGSSAQPPETAYGAKAASRAHAARRCVEFR